MDVGGLLSNGHNVYSADKDWKQVSLFIWDISYICSIDNHTRAPERSASSVPAILPVISQQQTFHMIL